MTSTYDGRRPEPPYQTPDDLAARPSCGGADGRGMMLDSDARVWEECAKVLYDHVKLMNQTWESAAVRLRELARGDVRADLTTAQQQGAGRVPLSKTLDRWDSEDLTARLAAAERVVEAARKVKDRLDPDMHERDIRSCRDDLLVALAAYPPTTQTEVKG